MNPLPPKEMHMKLTASFVLCIIAVALFAWHVTIGGLDKNDLPVLGLIAFTLAHIAPPRTP